MVTIDDLLKIGEQLPGTTNDIKWDHHLCFNVGEKMYLITSPDQVPINATFKVADERFDEMIAQPGIIAAPYMARNKWVQIDDISRLNVEEWHGIMKESHAIIASKLTKKKQKELGLL